MLVLSRKQNESIVIDGNIRIVVTAIHGGRVCIGIEAPPFVPVHRQEIDARMKRSTAHEAGLTGHGSDLW